MVLSSLLQTLQLLVIARTTPPGAAWTVRLGPRTSSPCTIITSLIVILRSHSSRHLVPLRPRICPAPTDIFQLDDMVYHGQTQHTRSSRTWEAMVGTCRPVLPLTFMHAPHQGTPRPPMSVHFLLSISSTPPILSQDRPPGNWTTPI